MRRPLCFELGAVKGPKDERSELALYRAQLEAEQFGEGGWNLAGK
jgi:hypothetical protein